LLDEDFNIKIIDFGFVCPLEGKTGSGFNHTKVGTPGYMAPELLQKDKYNGNVVDLYALAVILFIMYSGRPPFTVAAKSDDLYNLLATHQYSCFWQVHQQGKPEGFFTPKFKNLIEIMLQDRPGYRPDIVDIVGHDWCRQPEAGEELLTAAQVKQEMTKKY